MKKIIIAILNICICVVVLTTSVYAWYTNYFGLKPTDDIYLSSNSSYYDSGEGTLEKPYIITEARHLYNLAWLQDLGFYDDKVYYFKLGNDIDMSSIGKIPPIGIDGKGVGTKGDSTIENRHPFIGNFDGNNKTIRNLNISNFGFTLYPEMASNANGDFDSSFVFGNNFGLFGHFSAKVNTGETTTDSKISNLKISNVKVDVSQNSTTGMAVGYVDGPINDIGVATPKLSFSSGVTVKSDYGLIGETSDSVINDFDGRGSGQTDFEFATISLDSEKDIKTVKASKQQMFSYLDENKKNIFYEEDQYSVWGEVSLKEEKGSIPYFNYGGQVQVQSASIGEGFRIERAFIIHVVGNKNGQAKGVLKVAATTNDDPDAENLASTAERYVVLYKVEKTSNNPEEDFIKTGIVTTKMDESLPTKTMQKSEKVPYRIPANKTQYEQIIKEPTTFNITEPGYYAIGSFNSNLNFFTMDFKYTNPEGDAGTVTYSLSNVDFIATSMLNSNIADNVASTVTFSIEGTTTSQVVMYFRREDDKVYYYIPEGVGLTTKAYGTTGKHIKETSNTNFT